MRFFFALCVLLALPAAAQAKWLEASSAHFVVYADDKEKDVRAFSEQLERYHTALAIVTGQEMAPPSPSNRVTVYMVRNEREVQRLLGKGAKNIGGFYIPRAGGSLAVVPRVESGGRDLDFSMIALLHEYAHHFLISNSAFPSPRWLGEGAAEFFASARFAEDGGLTLGLPAAHRYGELIYAQEVEVEELLDPDLYEKRRRRTYDSFYGKSWALYHYLVFGEDRRGQLHQYMRSLSAGKRSRAAAEETFGDLKKLDRDVLKYVSQRKLLSMVFKPALLATGPIAVRELREGEAAMMPVRIRSRRGVTPEQAKELLVEARQVAARYSSDPAVLAALAEAEHDAGNDDKAIAAADAAIARDPGQVNAYIQKGFALFRMAGEAEDPKAAFQTATAPFLALNKIENDHPLPLIYFYRSFGARQMTPSQSAVRGLERAAELAPYDLDLRLNLATQQISEKRLDEAKRSLTPVAYNPHGGPMAEAARTILERIGNGSPPDAQEIALILQTSATPPASPE